MLFAGLIACETIPPAIQSGPDAEVTFDGLVRVDNSRMDVAWVRPGIDLSSYNQIMLVGAGIKYRSVREVNRLALSRASEFPLDAEQRERIEASVREVFNEELAKIDTFQVVQQAGPNTLALTGALIDVVSFVPPERAGRVDYYLSTLGAATLVLELSDSQSNQILARAVDGRAIDVVFVTEASRVSNTFEFEREMDAWADDIRAGIQTLHDTPLVTAQD